MKKLNLRDSLARFSEHGQPKIVGALNGQHVTVAKFKGEFVWHSHADADELFYVVHGRMEMQLRGETVMVEEGELIIIPRGVEHCPRADQEVHVMLFEPAGTLNTGDAESDRAVTDPEWLGE